jgi:hypothetical protein
MGTAVLKLRAGLATYFIMNTAGADGLGGLMAKTRKDLPLTLTSDQLYAVMRGLHRHMTTRNKPTGFELNLCREAFDVISTEYYARAEEEQRIDEELKKIWEDYDDLN